jgi:hypothetical protein
MPTRALARSARTPPTRLQSNVEPYARNARTCLARAQDRVCTLSLVIRWRRSRTAGLVHGVHGGRRAWREAVGQTMASRPIVDDGAWQRRSICQHARAWRFENCQNRTYDASSAERANCLLRDFRTDDVHLIVSSRLDILFDLQDLLSPDAPCEVISAYRSPETYALQLR